MIAYLEKKHGIKIKPNDNDLNYTFRIWNRVGFASYDMVNYRAITNMKQQWEEMIECHECNVTSMKPYFKEVVKVAVEDLSEEQKAEQRKPIEDIIKQQINAKS